MLTKTMVLTAGLLVLACSGDANAQSRERQHEPHHLCSDGLLQSLRIVRPEQIAELDEANAVHISPICDHQPAMLSGNANGLNDDVADNSWLAEKLDRAGYRADEVVGIRLGGEGAVVLYVHHPV